MTYNAIIEKAFYNATCSSLKRANKKFDWSDYQNALKYKDILEGDYKKSSLLIFETIGKVFTSGPNRDSAYTGAIRGVERYLSNDLASYIAVFTDAIEESAMDMQKQQINILRTIKAGQQLREGVHSLTGGRDLNVYQFTGLAILWCKKSKELLQKWVLTAVSNDKHVPAHPNTYNSVAPIDVSEFVSQVINQLNEIRIDDPFVWTQASELLVSTVLYYIEYESNNACDYFRSMDDDYNKKLEFVCVALSNIEKIQETLNDVVEEVENFMEAWKKTHRVKRTLRPSPVSLTKSAISPTLAVATSTRSTLGTQLDKSAPPYVDEGEDEESMRMEVTTVTVNDAISFAIMMSKKWMAAPLSLLGKHAAIGVTGIITAGIAGRKPVDDALSEVSAHYDEELSAISDNITQRMLKRALEEYLCTLLQLILDVSHPDYCLKHPEEGDFMDFTKQETRDRCTQMVDGLIKYFHADGAGINKSIIERNRQHKSIMQIIDAYKLSTEELITIVKQLTANPPVPLDNKQFEGIDPSVIDHIIRNKATTGDKWAIAYSKEEAGSEESTIIRTKLGLPPSEFLISSKHINNNIKHFFVVYIIFHINNRMDML